MNVCLWIITTNSYLIVLLCTRVSFFLFFFLLLLLSLEIWESPRSTRALRNLWPNNNWQDSHRHRQFSFVVAKSAVTKSTGANRPRLPASVKYETRALLWRMKWRDQGGGRAMSPLCPPYDQRGGGVECVRNCGTACRKTSACRRSTSVRIDKGRHPHVCNLRLVFYLKCIAC